MNKLLRIAGVVVLLLGLGVQSVEARRLGGATSKGVQRDSVTQRQASPQPTAPTQQVAPHPATPTPVPSSPTARRTWLGALAGLAAGSLGALLAPWGLGESLAGLLGALLLVAFGLWLLMRVFRRTPDRSLADSEPNLHYAGVGGPGMAPLPPAPMLDVPEPVAVPSGGIPRRIPADFDQEGFLLHARLIFIRLQAANDAGNVDDIREFATPEMLAGFSRAIAERQGGGQQTAILDLEAELLAVNREADRQLASVRFHGMIREVPEQPAQAFDEVWHLTQPADGSRGWAIAGIQQLD